MKNKILLLVLCSFVISNEWVNIDSNNPKTPEVDILFSNIDITEIEFTIPGFYLNPKNINDEIYNVVSMPRSASNLEFVAI